eukprot:CAMPEP_0201116360 /NCGR_PEP_ID=MMETSP0850-20130426/680_1 /ASSEMBLY_ACC=CAM_ASM_000622 /TAXON_ID=183588 /ORGANISM="Pseudo-nitzschia fraudulenta, Strain WWA7" /LENGTH=120 /DNA_ID=CAMNT_0047380429 /DNA_START=15 /DNA_END=377 /DNA_ORIENTATION=-
MMKFYYSLLLALALVATNFASAEVPNANPNPNPESGDKKIKPYSERDLTVFKEVPEWANIVEKPVAKLRGGDRTLWTKPTKFFANLWDAGYCHLCDDDPDMSYCPDLRTTRWCRDNVWFI